MKRIHGLTVLAALLLGACGTGASPAPGTNPPSGDAPSGPAHVLTVFAAASLTRAFGEIGKAFESVSPGVTVKFNFAGSQTLQAQIEQGAPVDVFASASKTNMDALVSSGFVDPTAPQSFLINKLVVILPPTDAGKVQALRDLSKPGVKVVLAADTVPAGQYARQILANMSKDPAFGTDFGMKVLGNVVSNETDVEQVVAKVQLGEADAGIVYVSDSYSAPTLKTLEIPDPLNIIAKYRIAPLIHSANPELAAEFVFYVLSADGQATLNKWGFTPIK